MVRWYAGTLQHEGACFPEYSFMGFVATRYFCHLLYQVIGDEPLDAYQRTNVTFGKLYVRSIGEKITLYYIYYIIYNIYNIKPNIPFFHRFHLPIENSKWYVGTLVRNDGHKKNQKNISKKNLQKLVYVRKKS